jgi:phenylalanyl-tRNA synthetase beta chain
VKFTLSWLKDYLDTSADIGALVETMTLAGLEVEHVLDPGQSLAAFTLARIASVRQHPNADRLQVCQVETVDGPREIVCGALNARAGLVTAYAPIGAFIPGAGITLTPRPVRGVVSNGMLCSGGELGVEEDPFRLRHDRLEGWIVRATQLGLSRDQAVEDGGILEFPDSMAVGTPLAEALGLSDPVIDFEVTPNRPDWLGVTGIARDLAAKGAGRLRLAPTAATPGHYPCPIEIRLEARDACPVFAGRLIRGVRNGPSPDWLRGRLKAIGIQPRSLLVDVTNYICHDRARPLHVYDAARLQGAIRARLGQPDDSLEALDGRRYDNLTGMCVIADDRGVIGLGGVMGGVATGCSPETTDVFIESAWFSPGLTARTGRTTGILSDARFRFERGVDPQSHLDGLELATRLILEYGGGDPSDVAIAGEAPEPTPPVAFRVADMARLTGIVMKPKRMEAILRSLGLDPVVPTRAQQTEQDVWPVRIPSFRPDIEGSADIVEELLRIEGFAALPDDPLPPPAAGAMQIVTPLQQRVRIGRRVMAARGFCEAATWSFMDREKARLFMPGGETSSALELENPIASDLNYMRPTILANLAEAIQRNMDHGATGVRLFEVGPVYETDQPDGQRTVLSGLVREGAGRAWDGPVRAYDAFAAKADVLAVLAALDQPEARFQIVPAAGPCWHPGRSASLRLGPKTLVASFGELHPRLLRSLRLDGPMVGFEIRLEALPVQKGRPGKTRALLDRPDQSPVRRDFAFLVAEETPAGEIVRLAARAAPKIISDARIFDVFRGAAIGDGLKSVALEVTLQPRGEALKDEQIEEISQAIINAVAKGAGGRIRG